MAELAEHVTTAKPPSLAVWRARAALRQRVSVRSWPAVRRFLFVLLMLYVGKQAISVFVFPAFSGHDEVAHFAYLETVAEEHRVPVLLEDRIPDRYYPYCDYVLDWPCFDGYERNPPTMATWPGRGRHPIGFQYVANHPPLYYVAMTPVWWLTDGASVETRQYWLRAAAIPFGLATVILAYMLTRVLFPRDSFLAITVPSFVAFQPQISYESAMVNNDIVAIALYSWIVYLLVVGIRDRFPIRTCVLTGFALGLALLAKGTSVTAAPLIAFAIILAIGVRDVRGWATRGTIVAGMAALLSWPWFVYLYRTYGNLSAFDQVAELQWWNYWGRDKPSITDLLVDGDFALLRWKETWGEFGWRRIHLGTTLLWWIGVPLIVALGGLVQYLATALRRRDRDVSDPVLAPRQWQTKALVTLFVTAIVAYVAVLQFGTEFELTQARYYFPAINAVALLLMLGLRTLIPNRLHRYGQGLVFAALLAMNVVIYTAYVVPYWHLEG